MKHNLLEKLGVSVPQLGLGCMRLPTDGDTIDYNHAQKIVDYAMAQGVNYFDTAYMYHSGESQYFLGKALQKYPRESYFLTNKLPIWSCKEASDMEKIFQDQLQRCRTEYFDFYFMHSMNDEHWRMAKEAARKEAQRSLGSGWINRALPYDPVFKTKRIMLAMCFQGLKDAGYDLTIES